MKNPVSKIGRLIVVEGADGVGKSTQLALLRGKLVDAGHTVALYDFPHKSGGQIGDLIGDFLRGEFGEVTPEFLALAFSLDRLESRQQLVADLADGKVVLCDRYVSSNIAFQTAKIEGDVRRSRLRAMLLWLEYELLQLPSPTIELVLTATDSYFASGRHRQRQRDATREYMGNLVADIHEDASNLQIQVNRYYSGLSDGPSLHKIPIFDGGGHRTEPTELHNRIWNACKELINADEATGDGSS